MKRISILASFSLNILLFVIIWYCFTKDFPYGQSMFIFMFFSALILCVSCALSWFGGYKGKLMILIVNAILFLGSVTTIHFSNIMLSHEDWCHAGMPDIPPYRGVILGIIASVSSLLFALNITYYLKVSMGKLTLPSSMKTHSTEEIDEDGFICRVEYDELGNEVRKTDYSPDREIIWDITYSYKNGELHEWTVYDGNGVISSKFVISYNKDDETKYIIEYDNEANKVSESEYES